MIRWYKKGKLVSTTKDIVHKDLKLIGWGDSYETIKLFEQVYLEERPYDRDKDVLFLYCDYAHDANRDYAKYYYSINNEVKNLIYDDKIRINIYDPNKKNWIKSLYSEMDKDILDRIENL